MRRLLLLIMLMPLGCATLLAADFQPTVDEERIQLGLTRPQLEAILGEDGVEIAGVPGSFEFLYEDTDAWKARKWIYYPFDVATMGGASLVLLTHVELAIQRAAKRRAVGVFDDAGELILFRETRSNRVRLGEPAREPEVSRESTFRGLCRMVLGERCRS